MRPSLQHASKDFSCQSSSLAILTFFLRIPAPCQLILCATRNHHTKTNFLAPCTPLTPAIFAHYLHPPSSKRTLNAAHAAHAALKQALNFPQRHFAVPS